MHLKIFKYGLAVHHFVANFRRNLNITIIKRSHKLKLTSNVV